MKRYIRAIEKLSIAELAKYKNSVVVATRRVVGSLGDSTTRCYMCRYLLNRMSNLDALNYD